jgi:hypothetical protein
MKEVMQNNVKPLCQILSVLVIGAVTDLASGDPEKPEVAGKCLGDIVSKLSKKVLPEIIPVLRNSLYDGVCVGLSEVIGSSKKDQILWYLDIIVKVVQDALCNEDKSVWKMAASCFQNIYTLVGSRAMDEVVPALIVALKSSEDDEMKWTRASNRLTGILSSIRSGELLPYIIPRLIKEPVTKDHAKALSSITAVTGDTAPVKVLMILVLVDWWWIWNCWFDSFFDKLWAFFPHPAHTLQNKKAGYLLHVRHSWLVEINRSAEK